MDNGVAVQYKDRLFRMLFGSEEYKENILSLYNALHGTAYDNPDDITLTTIRDAIYVGMKNDVSFLISTVMSLWEHQSTWNPNMPLRGLLYFSHIYEAYLTGRKLILYGNRQVKIPAPHYVIFYNGMAEAPDYTQLKLSDAFESPAPGYEWTAHVYNINKGRSAELLTACRPLAEYAELVARIRGGLADGLSTADAVERAVASCIKDKILEPFLTTHRAEVKDVCLTEYNREQYEKEMKEDSFAQGLLFAVRNLIASTGTTAENAMAMLNIPAADRPRYLAML